MLRNMNRYQEKRLREICPVRMALTAMYDLMDSRMLQTAVSSEMIWFGSAQMQESFRLDFIHLE